MAKEKVPTGTSIRNEHDLGAWIRAARKAQNVTLIEAAGLCGVGVRFLSELERGKPTKEIGLALQVATRMGLDLHVRPRWLEGGKP